MNKKIVGVIPSRLQSTRLPEKPLTHIAGLPLIAHIILRAKMSGALSDVYVATDNEKIAEISLKYGAKVIMTESSIPNGTERVAIASQQIDADVIVHINGDEILLDPLDIDRLVDECLPNISTVPGLLYNKTTKFNDESIFKVLLNNKKEVFCLTRSDVPSSNRKKLDFMYSAYFVTIYSKSMLSTYLQLPPSYLEEQESCNEMRFIESSISYRGVYSDTFNLSIDTESDIQEANLILKNDDIFKKIKAE